VLSLAMRAILTARRYVKDILTSTPQVIEQVTIEPDGKWLLPAPQSEEKSRPQTESSFIEDDDLVIGQVSSRPSNTATPSRSGYAFSTPAQGSSREGSSIAAPRSTASSKRPAAEVIDLTLSDDDDADIRPVKRLNTQFNGYSSVWGANG
jgi:E3 SUMO-protein ligase PIAS1